MTSIIVFTCSITDTFHQLKIQNLQVRFQSEGATWHVGPIYCIRVLQGKSFFLVES